ncbi:MAG TPA: 4'-phosphopantetheinyl transferase superfamily protein [Steroidobacteraceae bacterium]|nr:4'-phosphopantetheinyl transferase superfamily protein [Steroidobacteraceae bacterium]
MRSSLSLSGLSLTEAEVHLWLAADTASPEQLKAYEPFVSDDERRQAARFHFDRDRTRYLVTRALVRTTLSRYASIAPEKWTFATNAYGRPEISNGEAPVMRLSFNVSHSRGLIALAISRNRIVGVDIENIRGKDTSTAIAERYFAQDEVTALRALPAGRQAHRFFELWTLKESYIKARGMGLSLPLKHFSFNFPTEQSVRLTVAESLNDPADRWQFWQMAPSDTHLLALCIERAAEMHLTVREGMPLTQESILATSATRMS